MAARSLLGPPDRAGGGIIMYLERGRCALLGLAGMLLSPSTAALSVYTTASQWDAAVGGLVVQAETFNEAAEGPLASGSTVIQPKGILTIWLDSNNQDAVRILKAVDELNNGLEFQGRVCDQSLPVSTCAPKQLYIDFQTAAPVVAFAADWSGTSDQDVLTIQIGASITRLDQVPGFTGAGFLGFVDSTPFTRVSFGLANASAQAVLEGFRMDNVRIAEVPLPAAFILLASAVGALSLTRRQRGR